ncbi:MAG: TlpA disulfide reductase family protein [Flavobacteriaceae bacterium]|nr:TlpA disulfide reductase family protein [Flavobacteriaceae bacterium]
MKAKNHLIYIVLFKYLNSRDKSQLKFIISTKLIAVIMMFTVATCARAQNRTTSEQLNDLAKKLEQVKEGSILSDRSWLINNNKDTIYFKEFENKWVLIDFWSTGCIPCIKEFPYIEAFYKKHKSRIQVIGVSVDTNYKRFIKGYKKYNLEIPNFFAGGTLTNPFYVLNLKKYIKKENKELISYGTFIPNYVLISPKGIIVDKNIPKPSSLEFSITMNKYLSQ